jgi:hypothetical protein
MNYSDQIKSPKWQKKRLEILGLRGFKCEICGDEENQLHVHHRFYIKNRKAWEYDNDVFQVLCQKCHEKIHEKEKQPNFTEFELNLIESIRENKVPNREIRSLSYLLNQYKDYYDLFLSEFWEENNFFTDLAEAFNSTDTGVLSSINRFCRQNDESISMSMQLNELKDEIRILKGEVTREELDKEPW